MGARAAAGEEPRTAWWTGKAERNPAAEKQSRGVNNCLHVGIVNGFRSVTQEEERTIPNGEESTK